MTTRRTTAEKVDVQTRQAAVDKALRDHGIDVGLAWWEIVEKLIGPAFIVVPNLPTDAEAEALVDAFMKERDKGLVSPIMPLDTATAQPCCPDCGVQTPHPALANGDVAYCEVQYAIVCDGCGGAFRVTADPMAWQTVEGSYVGGPNNNGCFDDGVYYEHGELLA